MAIAAFQLGPSNYGRYLAVNRLLGNPSGLVIPSPSNPLYVALYTSGANPDGGPTPTEITVSGYSRQRLKPTTLIELSDGGTYGLFTSGNYYIENSVQIHFGTFAAAATIGGVAIVDSPTIGAGHIIAWTNYATPAHANAGDVVICSADQLRPAIWRGAYDNPTENPFPPGMASFLGQQRMAEIYNDGAAYVAPSLTMALFTDDGLQGAGDEPVDPDAYPKPPYPPLTEITDPNYARQPFACTAVGMPVNLYGDGVMFCPVTFPLVSFGAFAADVSLGGFAIADANTSSPSAGLLLCWNNYLPLVAGSGVVVDGRTDWYVAV